MMRWRLRRRMAARSLQFRVPFKAANFPELTKNSIAITLKDTDWNIAIYFPENRIWADMDNSSNPLNQGHRQSGTRMTCRTNQPR